MSWGVHIMTRLAAFALLCGCASPALAANAVTLTDQGVPYAGDRYTLGFEFSLATDAMIYSLGIFDDQANGLGVPASIGLWDLSGNLLASTTIAAGDGILDGLFRFQSITPYALTAGTHYVVGAYTTELATSINTDADSGTGSIDPAITIHRDRFSYFDAATTGGFRFPDVSNELSGGWLGGNFQFTVPEPESWTMMILGFGLAGAAMRARRIPRQVTKTQ